MLSLQSLEMNKIIQGIILKHRKAMEAREPKQDLLQILINTHNTNPEEFTIMYVYKKIRVFMFVAIVMPLKFLFVILLDSY
jgi:hypothetical protein